MCMACDLIEQPASDQSLDDLAKQLPRTADASLTDSLVETRLLEVTVTPQLLQSMNTGSVAARS
jgi:hypothetical protein